MNDSICDTQTTPITTGEIAIAVQEVAAAGADPQVTVVVSRGDEEIYRNTTGLFNTQALAILRDEIVTLLNGHGDQVDYGLATQLNPIRSRLVQERGREPDTEQPPPVAAAQPPVPAAVPRYVAILPSADNPTLPPCMRDTLRERDLTNFVLLIEETITEEDDYTPTCLLVGRMITAAGPFPLKIPVSEYTDNSALKKALYTTGGVQIQLHCSLDELRNAVAEISPQQQTMRNQSVTNNFGWTADGSAYLTPSLRISTAGIQILDNNAPSRVDLRKEQLACCLDLKLLDAVTLRRVKQHIVTDLLQLHDSSITHTLLGATAAAVLQRFIPNAAHYSVWLIGLTGVGKSFPAKLFMNFFGSFSATSGRFASWASTPNYVQRQGYYFKDALYLVDDYKPEMFKHNGLLLSVLQNYADGTARGRLNADASAKVTRPIRGLLLCTGEDMPEHNASTIARSVILHVPQHRKDIPRKIRCEQECENYGGVMADFIRWVLETNRIPLFIERYNALLEFYFSDIAGEQNDCRIAGNLAMQAASFEVFSDYFRDVWDGWQLATEQYIKTDLLTIRTQMMGESREQQGSEIFLDTLRDLIKGNYVYIKNYHNLMERGSKPEIGSVPNIPNRRTFQIVTSLAYAEVNSHLRRQGRPELKLTSRMLLSQLHQSGKLLNRTGELLLPSDKDPTAVVRVNNKQSRAFSIDRRLLLED